ncbi:MAG: hypothetical protein ABI702_19655 [Burkholderiales bacterium]
MSTDYPRDPSGLGVTKEKAMNTIKTKAIHVDVTKSPSVADYPKAIHVATAPSARRGLDADSMRAAAMSWLGPEARSLSPEAQDAALRAYLDAQRAATPAAIIASLRAELKTANALVKALKRDLLKVKEARTPKPKGVK